MSVEDDPQEPVLERLSATPEPDDSTKSSKKRKRGANLGRSAKKAAKKSKSKQAKADDDDEIDTELGINKAFSHMDNQLLADYVAQRTRKYESDLSLVELEDKYIPGMCQLGFPRISTDCVFL
jgi:protein CMS1